MLTKTQKVKREALCVQMRHHQGEELKLRRQIDAIDNKDKEKEMKKILGKCFLQKSDKGSGGHSGYVRVEKFRRDYTPVGTEISMYGQGKDISMNIQFNHGLFRDWIDNGHQISHARFNKMLKQAKGMIKMSGK